MPPRRAGRVWPCRRWVGLLTAILLALAAVSPSTAAPAQQYGPLTITAARASLAGATARLQLTILNDGYDDLQVLRVSTPAAGAARFRFGKEGQVATTLETLYLPAEESLDFRAAEMWIELDALPRPLAPGESFPLTLHFVGGGSATLDVTVGADEKRAF